MYSFDKPKHKMYINIYFYYLAVCFKWLQNLLGYKNVWPTGWRQKKRKYDPWWFTVNFSQYIIIFFNEDDTNEVKGSYHDDCLEKKKEKKNIYCIFNWGIAVSCSRNKNFVKCRVSETSDEIFFNVWCFAILAYFCIGAFFADQVELTKHIPYILNFM